ncbi:MAG: hypothetical protein MJ252_17800 [archaeon]|nr:hypothetical protein [archaeon]
MKTIQLIVILFIVHNLISKEKDSLNEDTNQKTSILRRLSQNSGSKYCKTFDEEKGICTECEGGERTPDGRKCIYLVKAPCNEKNNETERCICGTNELEFAGACYNPCPGITQPNTDDGTCDTDVPVYRVDPLEYSFDSDVIEYETPSNIGDFLEHNDTIPQIVDLLLGTNPILIVESFDFNYTFYEYNENNTKILEANRMVRINIDQCLDVLRKAGKVTGTQSVFVGQLSYDDYVAPSALVSFKLFSKNSDKYEEITTELCDSSSASITKNVDQSRIEADLKILQQIIEAGYNPFDKNDKIFTDHCIAFSVNDRDTTPTIRKENFLIQQNICGDDCQIKLLNADTMEIICDCEIGGLKKNEDTSNLLNADSGILEFFNMFGDINLRYTTCSNQFKIKRAGAFLSLPLLIIQIALCILYYTVSLNVILSKINGFARMINPPKKKKGGDKTQSPNLRNSQDAFSIEEQSKDVALNEMGKCNEKVLEDPKANGQIQGDIENGNGEEENKDNEVFGAEGGDQDEMDYLDAVDEDKRSFFETLKEALVEKQILLSTFLRGSLFHPFILRFSMFLFAMYSFFFFNAILYSEEDITEQFETKDLDFLTLLVNEIDEKAIYSSLLVIIVSKIFSLICDVQKRFLKIKTRQDMAYQERMLKLAMDIFKSRMRTYFVLIFICSIYFTYFLIVFTNVFVNIQGAWMLSSLISIIVNLIIVFFLCLIYTVLRKIALGLKVS